MKKPHFVKAVTALSLSACMIMSLAACSAADKSKKDKENTSEESKQVQQTDPVEQTHTSDKNKGYADDVNYTQLSSNPPSSYDPLTIDDLYDTWVNENGTYMYYSTIYDNLVDYLGTRYEIISVQDNGVFLTEGASSFSDYATYEYSPMPYVFFFPMYLQGDELFVGDEHLYRASSEKGQQYMEAIVEEITDVELQCTSYFEFNSVPVEFSGHGMIETDPKDHYFEEAFWRFEDGLLEMYGDMYSGYDDYINYGSIHRMSDDTYFVVSNYGAGVYLSVNKNDGYRIFDTDYVLYSLDDDATYFASVSDLTGTVTDADSNHLPDWDFTFIPNDDSMDYLKMDINGDTSTVFGYMNAMNTIVSNNRVTIFPRDSLAGQLLIYREDVVHGKIDNIFIRDKQTSTVDGITVDVEIIDWDGIWNSNTPDVLIDNDFRAYTATYIATYGPLVDLTNCGYTTLIKYTIPKSLFNSIDEILVADGYDSYIGNSHLGEDEYDVYEEGNNYIVTIEAEYTSYKSYVLTDCEETSNLYASKSAQDILSQNPNASLWGSTCATGDILDLVDLDYLEQSIVNDDGVAVFWVSTPEQLATATYYINEMDLYWDSYDTYYYIHLMDNIDLAGYVWAPIGINEYEHNYPYRDVYAEHYMTGIFFGNGKTIKNVYMDPIEYGTGFFGYCENTTVIGLTLSRPNPNGFVKSSYQYVSDFYDSYALAEPLGVYNEFIDCHVIIDSSDETCCPFPDADYTLSLYVDCSAFKIDSSTGNLTDLNFENSKSILYDTCTEKNWVADYYRTNDGGYSYDAASEYEDYLSDPTGFIDGSYYYGDGSDTPERYYDYWLAGYMYNGLFMTQYGCTVDPEYVDSIIPESGDEG